MMFAERSIRVRGDAGSYRYRVLREGMPESRARRPEGRGPVRMAGEVRSLRRGRQGATALRRWPLSPVHGEKDRRGFEVASGWRFEGVSEKSRRAKHQEDFPNRSGKRHPVREYRRASVRPRLRDADTQSLIASRRALRRAQSGMQRESSR